MIRKFLDCSIAHLPPDFRRHLWQGVGPFTDIGEDEYRRWVYVDENTLSAEQLAEALLPDAVQKIVRYALDNECNVICFDPDGPDLEGDFTVFFENDEETPITPDPAPRSEAKSTTGAALGAAGTCGRLNNSAESGRYAGWRGR